MQIVTDNKAAECKEQIIALYRAGLTVDVIAKHLEISELGVKEVVGANSEAACANGEIVFTPAELGTIKNNLMQLANTCPTDAVRAKVNMWIASQHVISASEKFKVQHGLKDGPNINNIVIAINAAKEKAAVHVK